MTDISSGRDHCGARMSVTGVGRPSLVSGLPHAGHHHGVLGGGGGHLGGGQPVPMKLFATWEVERTPPNCIPRLCSLTIARLSIFNSLDADLNSILIAVKMQSSKRTLRSNEIQLPPTGHLDTELDLAFSLQYPHFLKREGNTLQIMLQRRKKYKNRTILGYKTLAVGIINMSQVLQRQMDLELELVEGKNGNGSVLGKVFLLSLSSQPVDHEDDLAKQVVDTDRGLDLGDSDEDEDFTSGDEGSDSEPMIDSIRGNSGRRKSGVKSKLQTPEKRINNTNKFPYNAIVSSSKELSPGLFSFFPTNTNRILPQFLWTTIDSKPNNYSLSMFIVISTISRFSAILAFCISGLSNSAARQRNIKQKFVALLRRFKVTEPEDLRGAFKTNTQHSSQADIDPEEIEDLIRDLDLEGYSDDYADHDNISTGSTPKPSLRPFFSSSRSLIRETLDKPPYSILEKPELGSDHLSDDSSKGAI